MSVACCPAPIGLGVNALPALIGELTVMPAVAVLAVRPRVLTTCAGVIVLVSVCEPVGPEAVPTTFTFMVQVPFCPTLPPVTVSVVAFAAGANVPFTAPVPVQLILAPGVGAT